ncbi:MAG: LysE family translocator [Pseudomonadota bacterium]
MPYELFIAVATFAFVTSVTPGPNNLMLLASGANYGFRRTIPHMLGISLGVAVMIVLVGLGLAAIFAALPVLRTILLVLSVIYMLFLAWKIAMAAPMAGDEKMGKPFTFLQAAAFQWVNPKAWGMVMTAVSVYAPGDSITSMLVLAVVFSAINLPTVSAWAVLGQQLRSFLQDPARLRAFNTIMAFMLVGSLYFVF